MDRSWEYINCSQTHECRNWDWSRAIPFLGIHKLDFQYSVGPWSGRATYSSISICNTIKHCQDDKHAAYCKWVFSAKCPAQNWGDFFGRFVWMCKTSGPSISAWPWGKQSHSPLWITTQTTKCCWCPFHSFAMNWDTHNSDRQKSTGLNNLFNIWTIGAMDRTSAQPLVKLRLLASTM